MRFFRAIKKAFCRSKPVTIVIAGPVDLSGNDTKAAKLQQLQFIAGI